MWDKKTLVDVDKKNYQPTSTKKLESMFAKKIVSTDDDRKKSWLTSVKNYPQILYLLSWINFNPLSID